MSSKPVDSTLIDRAHEVLAPSHQILVFSGAGLSTESGIPDFRGPDGLWTKVDPADFTIQRYHASRDVRVRRWQTHVSGQLWGDRSNVRPNEGHRAIYRLHLAGRLAGVVTQNIDGLHQSSGLDDEHVAELHGNVRNCSCLDCGRSWPTDDVLEWVKTGDEDPHCPDCNGLVKTDTVMFGEMLPEEEQLKAGMFLAMADAVLVVGSTVSVWPAADVVIRAAHLGLPIVIVNRGETDVDRIAAVKIDSSIGETLPILVDRLLA